MPLVDEDRADRRPARRSGTCRCTRPRRRRPSRGARARRCRPRAPGPSRRSRRRMTGRRQPLDRRGAWPVAKLTPSRKTSASSSACSAIAASRSLVRTVARRSAARRRPGPTPDRARAARGGSSGRADRTGRAGHRQGSGAGAPDGRKNEASSRWMLTVSVLRIATSARRAPDDPRHRLAEGIVEREPRPIAGSNQASTPRPCPARRAPPRPRRAPTAAGARATGRRGRSRAARPARPPSGRRNRSR